MCCVRNSLMLYQPCAAKTYTSSKVMDHLSVLIQILTHAPTTRKKQRSRHGVRNYAKNAARQLLGALPAQLTQLGKNVA